MIPVKNIYYMLSYAFHILKEKGVKEVDVESFDNVAKLCAEILIKGVRQQIKRGFAKEYIEDSDSLMSIRGKIDVSQTVNTRAIIKRQLVCNYTEFSEDIELNQIIKTALILLLKADITSKQRKSIKGILVYFANVEEIDIYRINWNIHYNRNNLSYQLIIAICYLVVKGLLQTQSDGSVKLMDFIDDQRMSRLYEKFLLEYYKTNYPELTPNANYIKWQLDTDESTNLPAMKSDIMLQKGNNVIVIDAKYYTHNMQVNYDKYSIHSGNLYQIFTYVKNKEYELRNVVHNPVEGIILYAKTDADIQAKGSYYMSGNHISVKVLDLNCDYQEIEKQLNAIVDHFK